MSGKFPYVPSAGPLLAAVNQLRKSFPAEVNADTLKRLGIAPKNESFVISTLRFLKLLDDKGKKSDLAAKVLLNHDTEQFEKGFEKLVHAAYHELFELQGEGAWELSKPKLVQFFRTSDQSSELVGMRQAGTFQCLAALSGHAALPASSKGNVKASRAPTKQSGARTGGKKVSAGATNKNDDAQRMKASGGDAGSIGRSAGDQTQIGMTVRIEVNLPAGADQDTYDAIFKSIRKNLIDA